MCKLANLAASSGVILPAVAELRMAIPAELKTHSQRHYRTNGRNEMDELSAIIRHTRCLRYLADLVNSLVKLAIPFRNTVVGPLVKALGKSEQ